MVPLSHFTDIQVTKLLCRSICRTRIVNKNCQDKWKQKKGSNTDDCSSATKKQCYGKTKEKKEKTQLCSPKDTVLPYCSKSKTADVKAKPGNVKVPPFCNSESAMECMKTLKEIQQAWSQVASESKKTCDMLQTQMKQAECGKRSAECGQKSDECDQKPDECGQRNDECGQKNDKHEPKSDGCGRKSDVCAQKYDECGQKNNKCGQRSDESGQKSAGCGQKSAKQMCSSSGSKKTCKCGGMFSMICYALGLGFLANLAYCIYKHDECKRNSKGESEGEGDG